MLEAQVRRDSFSMESNQYGGADFNFLDDHRQKINSCDPAVLGSGKLGPEKRVRHYKISDQAGEINIVLRGHYAYYGVAGNLRSLVKVYRAVERHWRKMLRSRSWAGRRLT